MSTEDQQEPALRVGGWVPPLKEGAAGPGGLYFAVPEATSELPVVPVRGGSTGGRRRGLVVAGAALAVLGVSSFAVYEAAAPGDAASARFVSLPSVPAVPMFPVPQPSVSAHGSPGVSGSAAGSVRTHKSGSAPASVSVSAPAPAPGATSAPAPASAPAAPPATSAPATTPPTTTPARSGPFVVGAAISLQPAGQDRYRVRHRDYRARVERMGRNSALDKADSTFIVRAGLADGGCVSFESSNYPGYYLRHRDGQIWLDRQGGGGLYAADATFCADERDRGRVALRSYNYPSRFLSVHRGKLDLDGRSTEFTVRAPL